MDSLPEDTNKWYEWMRRLADKGSELLEEDREVPSSWKDGGAKSLWRAARSLYRRYPKIQEPFPSDIKIPCVCLESGRRSLTFALPEYVHWIDKPHLMDSALENALLSQRYKLFIFRLQEADESEERFSVRRLSDAVNCRPRFITSSKAETRTPSRR